jgi:hypothetical protein
MNPKRLAGLILCLAMLDRLPASAVEAPDFKLIFSEQGSWPGERRVYPWDVLLRNHHAFVTTDTDLRIFDLIDPANPNQIATVPGVWGGIAISGNFAYLLGGNIVDISDPAKPVVAGSIPLGSWPWAIAASGNRLFVTGGWGSWDKAFYGLHIFDLSDPVRSNLLGSFVTEGGSPQSVAVSGNYAYVPDGQALNIIDFSNPSALRRVAKYPLPGYSQPVQISGTYAYVSSTQGDSTTLNVLDISNPANPVRIGQFSNPNPIRDIYIAGNRLWFVDFRGGLKVMDISDPAKPALVGSQGMGLSYYSSLSVSGDRAAIVDWVRGFQLIVRAGVLS